MTYSLGFNLKIFARILCNPQRAQEKREKLGAVIESIEKVLGQKIVIIIVTYITFTFCQHLMLSKFQIAKNREI